MRFLLFFIFLFHSSSAFCKEDTPQENIQWLDNFEQAAYDAYHQKKPLLLYFSGSDWCRWCQKIQKEVLQSQDFIKYLSDFFLFVEIDFPKNQVQNSRLIQQNAQLKNRFSVRSFPTLILLDHEQNELDRMGYMKGGGKAYREKIFQILKDYEIYKESLSHIDTEEYQDLDLSQLYKTAQKFKYKEDSEKILNVGLKQNLPFFQLEKYQIFAKLGKRKSAKAIALKNAILDSDPEDKSHYHYRIAVIDFEANLKDFPEKHAVMQTIKPLTDYLARFAHPNNNNSWKVQITIAQTLLDSQRPKEALSFAKQSLSFAPQPRKGEIQQTVSFIENLILQQDPSSASSFYEF